MNEMLAQPIRTVIECIESWHDGTEWYRVYSDGFIEQGGQLAYASSSTIANLNKEFSNNLYTLILSLSKERGTEGNSDALLCGTPISSKTFAYRMKNTTSNTICLWYACGW